MKNKLSFNISVLWIVLMFVLGVAILLIAPKGELLSDTENRMLTAMPEINSETVFSGEFSQDFELFLTDKFFGRNAIVALASDVRGMFSVLDFDDILEFGDGVEDTFVEETPDVTGSSTDLPGNTSSQISQSDVIAPPADDSKEDDDTENGSFPSRLSYRMNKANGGYTPLYNLDKEDVYVSAGIVNKYARLLPDDGNLFYINVLQAWKINKYVSKINSYTSLSSNVDSYMQTVVDDNVKIFSFTEIFDEPIRRKEYVFFRTDTHWTPLGAHYAYSEMMSYQGIEPIPYDAYDVQSINNFLGAYYNMYQTTALREQADRLDIISPVVPVKYYKCESNGSRSELPLIDRSKGVEHAIYLGGNKLYPTVLCSEAGTGRNALMIKDSFGLIPSIYFSAHYDEFFVLDPRFINKSNLGCTLSQFIEKNNISDIYFVVSDINGHGKDFTTKYTKRLV